MENIRVSILQLTQNHKKHSRHTHTHVSFPVVSHSKSSCDTSEPMTEDAILDYEHRKRDMLMLTTYASQYLEQEGLLLMVLEPNDRLSCLPLFLSSVSMVPTLRLTDQQ